MFFVLLEKFAQETATRASFCFYPNNLSFFNSFFDLQEMANFINLLQKKTFSIHRQPLLLTSNYLTICFSLKQIVKFRFFFVSSFLYQYNCLKPNP